MSDFLVAAGWIVFGLICVGLLFPQYLGWAIGFVTLTILTHMMYDVDKRKK